jgi:protein-S-isoprenylcysteine O-methyltransferase Ste14
MKKAIFRLVGAAIVGLLALGATSMDRDPRLAIGIVVGLPSFVLMIISRRQLGKAFSMMPEARALVTTGLYSRIQHPMYLFLDLFLVALIIVLNGPFLFLVWGIIVVVQALQTRREEKVLAATFGTDYNSYEAHTWF